MVKHSENMDEPIMTNRMILSDLHKKVNELHAISNELYAEVFGHETSGRLGYGKRIYKLETKQRTQTKLYIWVSTISSGISAGIMAIIHFLQNNPHHE